MSNPIYRGRPNPYANIANQFNQFRQSFQGNAQAEVQRLLETGQMSQQEYNRLQGMAQQMFPYMRG